jgi:hypothetical protein
MLSTGIVQLLKPEEEVVKLTHLGYPIYFLAILGIWKILGCGSAQALGDRMSEMFPSLLLLILTVVPWYFRPENRKIVSVDQ